mgnify:CR=1 FL=1
MGPAQLLMRVPRGLLVFREPFAEGPSHDQPSKLVYTKIRSRLLRPEVTTDPDRTIFEPPGVVWPDVGRSVRVEPSDGEELGGERSALLQ